jgi:hypothetical protein
MKQRTGRLALMLVQGLGLLSLLWFLGRAGGRPVGAEPAGWVPAPAGNFAVITTQPTGNGRILPTGTTISATFSQAVNLTTVTSETFTVRGRHTGSYQGSYVSSPAGDTVIFWAPDASFYPGEELVVTLNREILATNGDALIPFNWQFRTPVQTGSGFFQDRGARLGTSRGLSVSLADLDGDDDLDAFVTVEYSGNEVWFNDGTGTFTDSGQRLGSAYSSNADLGDLDSDGDLDAFVSNGTWNAGEPNEVWFNDGIGTFTDSGQRLGNRWSNDSALGDLDGDGDLDAYVGNNAPNEIWLNDGTGFFTDSGQDIGSWVETWSVALGDLDGDGDLDAVEANHGDGQVTINDGAGNFSNGQTLSAEFSHAVALGDLDGDGDLDAFMTDIAFTRDIYSHKAWFNDGSGSFVPGTPIGDRDAHAVALGDVDADGDLDLLTGNMDYGQGQYDELWINNGNGTFYPQHQEINMAHTRGVALGDLDGDGDLDAFFANWWYDEPDWVWFNEQDATDVTLTGLSAGSRPVSLYLSLLLTIWLASLILMGVRRIGRQSDDFENNKA